MITDEQMAEIRQNAASLYPTAGLEGMAMTTTAVAIQEAKQKAFLLGFIEGQNAAAEYVSKELNKLPRIQYCSDCPISDRPSHECMKMFVERCGYSCNKGKYKEK